MNALQIEAAIVQKTKDLPEEMLQEVLDFIEFLKFRKLGRKSFNTSHLLTELDRDEALHLEKEFEDYDKIYPKE